MVARAWSECARRAYGARTRPPEGQGASFPFDSCFQVPTARAWCAQAPRALGDVEATGSLWGARLMPSGGEGLCGAEREDARRAGGGGPSHVAEMACIGSLHASASPAAVHRLRRMALCSWLRTARVVYYAALTPLFLPLPSLWFLPSLLLFFSFSLLPSPPSIPSLDYCNLLFLVRVPRRYGSQPSHEFVTDFVTEREQSQVGIRDTPLSRIRDRFFSDGASDA